MSSALIQVGLAELEGLEGRIRRLECAFDNGLYARLSDSKSTADAYGDWLGKWSKNREEVTETIDRIGDVVHTIVESFRGVDEELAAQLDQGGAP